MLDKNKEYTLNELLNMFSFFNIDSKYYGNREKGDLELYLKTDIDTISVFKSVDKLKTLDYLKLTEEEARDVKFRFDREVDEMDLDIIAIVVRTSDINIPSNKYKLETLDRLTKEQDLEYKNGNENNDGISYIIVDQNTTCPLYDDVYLFGNDEGGFIKSLETRYEKEADNLRKDNLKMILDYYKSSIEEKIL